MIVPNATKERLRTNARLDYQPLFEKGARVPSGLLQRNEAGLGWPEEFATRIVHTFIVENNFSGREVCDTDALEIL